MKELKITKDQYCELCCAGKLFFVNHNVFCVNSLTWFDLVAVSVDVNTDEKELIKIVVE